MGEHSSLDWNLDRRHPSAAAGRSRRVEQRRPGAALRQRARRHCRPDRWCRQLGAGDCHGINGAL